MSEATGLLLPPPREVATPEGALSLPERPAVSAGDAVPEAVALPLIKELAALGRSHHWISRDAGSSDTDVRFEIEAGGEEESYRLEIGARGIVVRGASAAGLRHGASTLAQWLRLHPREDGAWSVPFLRVADRPDFPVRGVMLDISRDKVPRLETLQELIDMLAGFKINQVQLYMEHTFAYAGHERIWRDASPLTADDIRQLDAYCRARFIDLVPNQNSFGHFHRWLIHEPYRALAECPGGIEHPFSFEREPYSLCPIDPAVPELLAGLYNQLLPCFESRTFNVGLDETFDLGSGRSAAACTEHGKGRVYLDFLKQVHALAAGHGRRIQFWGDVILNYPELLEELPEDAVALEWGYEADHPFAEDTARFAASGLDFHVCPGTGSWNSFAGRTRNTIANLASAAVNGHEQGAGGMLITDWGDHGHLQPLPVSYAGLAAGAVFAWNVDAARQPGRLPVAEMLDRHVFRDPAGVTGVVVTGLGDAYLHTGATAANGSPLFFALLFADKPSAERRGLGMTAASLRRTLEYVESSVAPLPSARMERADAGLIGRELGWVADVLRFACSLATARLDSGDEDRPLSALPSGQRGTLAGRLDELIERHREIWLGRNRLGGLEDSVGRLRRLGRLLIG
ncbi:MAG: family 20 glycosylhydrolase [bacterium]|nr:family 20 glycosylhydrolase [bacterium]